MTYRTTRAAVVVARGHESDLLPRQFFDQNGECTLLEYVLDTIWTVTDEICIVFSREPSLKLIETIAPFGAKLIIKNEPSFIVPMLTVGFKASRSEYCLAVRENTPFLKPNVLFALFEAARGYDASLPRWPDGKVEPLLAVYRRRALLSAASQNPDSDDPYTIIDNLYAVNFVNVDKELKLLDPELHSFVRIENEEDLAKARGFATVRGKP